MRQRGIKLILIAIVPTQLSESEMWDTLSIVVYLGLVKVTAARDLWRKDNLFRFPFPASVMKGYRYEAITAHPHGLQGTLPPT